MLQEKLVRNREKAKCNPNENCIGPEVMLAVERAGWEHKVSPKKPINLLKLNTLYLVTGRGCHDTRILTDIKLVVKLAGAEYIFFI